MQTEVLDWLMTGDASIRWQVQRDLLGKPPEEYQVEQAQVAETGWGAELLARQDEDGKWGGGWYSPKWTSTTYTLLLLFQMGLPPGNPQALRGCAHFFARDLEKDGGINLVKNMRTSETCINGMLLGLLTYFGSPDPRVHSVANFLLHDQMPDGGWNCRRPHGATHSSFHTTILALEGLREYCRIAPDRKEGFQPAIERAHEFLLQHQLYQSHRTGQPARQEFTRMCFPPRWHYDFLRSLDYFQSINAARDDRMQAAIDLLISKQNTNGTWSLNQPWAGKVFFTLETPGHPSRWNTLRALRVLKWWEG